MEPDRSPVELHAHLHGIVQEWLARPLRDLFDDLDDRLFNLAERSRAASQQQLYFDALRSLRLARADLETRFLQSADQSLHPLRENDEYTPLRGALTLLEKDEQEETMQLEIQAQHVSRVVAPALTALLARLSALAQQPPPKDPLTSAISPRGLSRAFRAALDDININVEIRLIAVGLFGVHLMPVVDPLYAELNTCLREAGVLPDLADTATEFVARVQTPAPHRVPRPMPAEAEVRKSEPARTHVLAPDGNDERIDELQRLVSFNRRERSHPSLTQEPAAGPHADGPVLDREILDQALDELWTFDEDPLAFKGQLLAKSRALAKSEHAQLSSDDEDVIDMIGLLFTRIRADLELPSAMRKLLARLHVPFLRTALREPDLLRGNKHPARELLDQLGATAVGWCDASDPAGDVLKQVALTVEQLAAHREGVQSIEYSHALNALHLQQDTAQRRAELAESRTIDTVIGRERLELARNRVSALIQQRLRSREPLPWVRQLLRGPWAHHLALLWLRHSENSQEFIKALAFIDELLWVDDCNNQPADPARLELARDTLPRRLRQGLEGVTQYDSEIESLVQRLEAFLETQATGEEPPVFAYETDPSLLQADIATHWKDAQLENQPDAAALEQAPSPELRALQPDTWFEFRRSPTSEGERARLCWTSPYSGRYLFVSRNGARTRELSPHELADSLESGMARVLDDSRLLERNLRALITQLRQATEGLELTGSLGS
ncbi:MAG TPA: DUF1631 family protein [Chiayiivirga sp.]|nr:DUF1631 family protein [Chiayiivirga sp.]